MSIFMDPLKVYCSSDYAPDDYVQVSATKSLDKIYVSCFNVTEEAGHDDSDYIMADVSLTVEKAEALINHLQEAIAFIKGE